MARWDKEREALVDMDKWSAARTYIQSKLSLRSVAGTFGLSNDSSHAMVPCLFHDEKVPSFSISYEGGVWHCFSCQRGGTVIDLIRHTETLLHSNPLDRYSVIDFILKKYPVLVAGLGYSTVFRDPEQKLEEDLANLSEINVDVGEQMTASSREIKSLQRVCGHLVRELNEVRFDIAKYEKSLGDRSEGAMDDGTGHGAINDDDGSNGEDYNGEDYKTRLDELYQRFNTIIDKCMFLGKAGELGLPESYIIEKLTAATFEDTLHKAGAVASEKVLEQASEAFEDLLLDSE